MRPLRRLKIFPTALLAVLLLLTTGCLPDPAHREIRDLERMPQHPLAYLDPASASQPLIAPARQQELATGFLERHFAAWHAGKPLETTRNPFWAVDWTRENAVFAENLRPLTPARLRRLISLADPAAYPSLNRRAIILHRTNLRALPTQAPLFNNPDRPGEGFPFDLLQHAAVAANTPVLATHQSAEGSWIFVETTLAYGWVPVADLAWVDEETVRAFESGHYLVVTHDEVPVVDAAGRYRFQAGIGSLLPLTGNGTRGYRILVAVADQNRQALLTEATIPPDRGGVFPLPLTSGQLATLAGRMVGQPYGWGDSFEGRDCSGTVRDLFAPFGLWLPRNSASQARVGTVVPLAGLTPRQREQRLLAEGVPLLTLVRLPGHIMLYLGEYEGRAALLHSIWGLRTENFWGQESRWILGKTVITTLEPGRDLARPGIGISRLVSRVSSMNLLLPADSDRPHNGNSLPAED